MDIKDKLKKIIAEIATAKTSINEINDETVLTDDLGFDSIQMVSLIVEIESTFGITMEDDDLDIEKLNVFKHLTKMLEEKYQNNNDI